MVLDEQLKERKFTVEELNEANNSPLVVLLDEKYLKIMEEAF